MIATAPGGDPLKGKGATSHRMERRVAGMLWLPLSSRERGLGVRPEAIHDAPNKGTGERAPLAPSRYTVRDKGGGCDDAAGLYTMSSVPDSAQRRRGYGAFLRFQAFGLRA